MRNLMRSMGIKEMLKLIDGPNAKICLQIYRDNRALFKKAPGSTHNHQAWTGGYHDHIQEGMNWGTFFYVAVEEAGRKLPFSLSDFLLVFFLHDIEKPWKYELLPNGQLRPKRALTTKEAQYRFRDNKLKEYGIVLSVEQENAMRYAEGERNDYTNHKRMMNELAGFVHMLDVWSARVCHNYPRKKIPNLNRAARIQDC